MQSGRPFKKGNIPWNTGKGKSLQERLFQRRAIDPINGCWLWIGARGPDGYGKVVLDNERMTSTHRASFSLFKGPIAKGMQVDHLCFVRNCFNPDHLELVTPRENSIRAKARQTHCKNGHEFIPQNTYINPRGGRECRTCRNESSRKMRESNYVR